MIDGLFLQTVEGLGDPPPTGLEIWECLQSEKEEVTGDILSEGPLCQTAVSGPEVEVSEESDRSVEWRHRGQLEARLREINEAQDRLMMGDYGRCMNCGSAVDGRRLAADPAATLCILCQKNTESEFSACTL